MRPDSGLADVTGLTFGADRAEANLEFLAVDTGQQPGSGIYAQSMQYHGVAANYTLNGASSLATLYNDIDTASSNPAATIHTFGSGKAATFAFDLAKSIVLTRQGNPAWKDTEGCDGLGATRPMDMFVRCDGQQYLEPRRVGVPQADELQRFFANLVQELASDPLPRLWYLPGLNKTIIVNTGDGEDNSGSDLDAVVQDAAQLRRHVLDLLPRGRHQRHVGRDGSRPGARPVMKRVFMPSAIERTPACRAPTSRSPTHSWRSSATSHGRPEITRSPGPAGPTWPRSRRTYGTRLDTNYYHYANWLITAVGKSGANGWFNGSGLAQRFSDETGAVLPIYQGSDPVA